MDAYGEVLGRLVCFFIRHLDAPLGQWKDLYPLTTIQEGRLRDLGHMIISENESEETIDAAFHRAVKALFCWQEPRLLMDEIGCPVQRFLVCSSIQKGGRGFINAKEVG